MHYLRHQGLAKSFAILLFSSFLLFQPLLAESFEKNYVAAKLSRNDPLLDARKSYRMDRADLKLGFFHFNENSWLVGIESGYMRFQNKQTSSSDIYFVLQQQSLYIYRLDYPLYFGGGTQLSYLLPTLNAHFPPDEEKKRHRHMAVGLTASLFILAWDSSLFRFEICRWRSLRDDILHATETSFGVYIPIR